ncbi:Lrp/AsnC family transcriptional regulator [Nakamurella sp. A5-74]|uniref:Lrp/AsnC family transcriptional regulator n=1 Tax=Nakamurella sp. A5-74 TaxID=3158264 RepID=A0AAU8DUA3_9ACTN
MADRPDVRSDDVDRDILRVLAADGRIANNALAERVGIAASTCLARVRALRESGAIRGIHADVDPAALGLPLQAMIAVRVQSGSRSHMMAFADHIRRRPEVRNVYFLAGADDFLVHVTAADSAALREFVVDALSARPEVALTETNLIFEHLRGAGLPG